MAHMIYSGSKTASKEDSPLLGFKYLPLAPFGLRTSWMRGEMSCIYILHMLQIFFGARVVIWHIILSFFFSSLKMSGHFAYLAVNVFFLCLSTPRLSLFVFYSFDWVPAKGSLTYALCFHALWVCHLLLVITSSHCWSFGQAAEWHHSVHYKPAGKGDTNACMLWFAQLTQKNNENKTGALQGRHLAVFNAPRADRLINPTNQIFWKSILWRCAAIWRAHATKYLRCTCFKTRPEWLI